jgi:hypothetical protein
MKKLLMATAVLIAVSSYATAQETEMRVTPDALTWKENPAFPKGVQIATVVGDPTKAGDVVVLRIKFPPNFQMPPHTHPYSEVVTLISGPVGTSHGEKFEDMRITRGPGMKRRSCKSSSLAQEASTISTPLTTRARITERSQGGRAQYREIRFHTESVPLFPSPSPKL